MNKIFLLIFTLLTSAYNICYGFDTKAEYAILVDFNTEEILYEKKSDQPMPPSSMSKLMTIYTVFEALKKKNLNLDDKFIVSENAWRKGGSKMFIHVNDQVSVADLLRGIIIQSGNDACVAIAEGISGSEESFVELMNQQAKEIGLNNSNFTNSTGWPDPEHFMSPKDLSILAIRLIKDFPEYYYLFSERDFTFNNIKQENRNMLLSRNIGVDGLKTGHTQTAGYGITASAKKGERRLILVVNGLKGTVERAVESEKLLQYGFLNFSNINLFKAGEVLEIAEVSFGKNKFLPLTVKDDIILTLPKHLKKELKASISYDSPIQAPIIKDQIIGTIIIELPNKQTLSFDLLAAENIEEKGIIKKFFRTISKSSIGKLIN